MKLTTPEFREFEEMTLEELHKRAYESIDREDNYNLGEHEDIKPTPDFDDYSIEEEIKNPYDYGSPEFITAMEKIKANRDKHRKTKETEHTRTLILNSVKKSR